MVLSHSRSTSLGSQYKLGLHAFSMTQGNSAIEHSSVIDDFPNVKVTCRPNMQVAEDPSEALVAGGVCDIQPGPFRR